MSQKINYPAWYDNLMVSFQEFLESHYLTDTSIICHDGVVRCHSIILGQILPYLAEDPKESDEQLTIILPDFSVVEVKVLIDAIYANTGHFQAKEYFLLEDLVAQLCIFSGKKIRREVKTRKTPKIFCPLCSKSRASHKSLLPQDTVKGCLYKCCQCLASKLTPKSFIEHTHNHIEKKFKCEICRKGFSYRHILNSHLSKEHSSTGENLKLKCDVENCDFVTKYRQTLYTHKKEKHEGPKRSKNQQNVECPSCKVVLKKWYYHQYHRKTCGEDNLMFQCHICEQKGFVNQTTLRNHMKSKHSDQKPFQCEYCPAKYATAISLSGHRSRKHNITKSGEFVPQIQHPCQFCGTFLTTKTKLNQHIKVIHERQRDFQCKFCDKEFTSKSNLKIHEGTIHTGILPYKCDSCEGRSFARKKLLAEHIKIFHKALHSKN